METMHVVYENLLHHYSTKPSDWVITNICVKSRTTAIWEGVRKEGWVIFTDASVSSYGAGWAFAAYHHGFCVSIQSSALEKCHIFTAKAKAILFAIQFSIEIKSLRDTEVIEIRSDAQSVIRALESTIVVDPMLRAVKDELRAAVKKRVNVVLKWIPNHSEILENDMVDTLAKTAVDSRIVRESMWCKRDLRASIQKRINEAKRVQWNDYKAKVPKLCFPEVGCFEAFLKSSPSVNLCQLVSGHCRLNAFMCNKMAVVSSLVCGCNMADETVAHYLLSCPTYEYIREEIWPDFEPTFDFIRKDWRKVDSFIKKTKRFESS